MSIISDARSVDHPDDEVADHAEILLLSAWRRLVPIPLRVEPGER